LDGWPVELEIARDDHADTIGRVSAQRIVSKPPSARLVGLCHLHPAAVDGARVPEAAIASLARNLHRCRVGLDAREQLRVAVSRLHVDLSLHVVVALTMRTRPQPDS